MKNQNKKKVKKVVKAKSKNLTQRIEALKELKINRQKLTKKIETIEEKLVVEVVDLKDQIQEEPKQPNPKWDSFAWRYFVPIKGCECERCTEYRVRFGNKTQK